jgi:BMFP domain-containing protein YqiC
MTQLQRLIITFKPEETIMHALYRTQDGPGPNTKARRREVEQLVREGLRQAFASLEGRVDLVGTSGYEVREDIVLCTAKGVAQLNEHKGMKRGA